MELYTAYLCCDIGIIYQPSAVLVSKYQHWPLKNPYGSMMRQYYNSVTVNKSLEKTKTNNFLVRLSELSDFATLSVTLSHKPMGT